MRIAYDATILLIGGVPGGGEGRFRSGVSPYGRYDVKPQCFSKYFEIKYFYLKIFLFLHFSRVCVTVQNMRRYSGTVEERFAKRYIVNPLTGCWDWQGGVSAKGYGRISAEGRSLRASRVSWEIHYPDAPIGKLCVCHTCDRPVCVNPEHLFLGTPKDNAQDSKTKGRRYRPPLRAKCKQGHLWTTKTVRWRIEDGRMTRQCRICENLCRQRAAKETGYAYQNARRLAKRDAFIGPTRPRGRPPRRGACKHGHLMTVENTYQWRHVTMCRTCMAERSKAQAQRLSLARRAGRG